jgi:hypothetical protein
VRGGGVEVIVVFFDILAVIALGSAQAEETLFQNRIAAIPEREGETEALVIVADAGDAVFGPTIRSGAGMVVGEIIPRVSISAIILPRISPRALGEIGPPAPPVFFSIGTSLKTFEFSAHPYYKTIVGVPVREKNQLRDSITRD